MPPSIVAPPKIKGTASGVAGAYTKLSIVGKGAFGDIFLVRDTQKGGETLIMKQVQTKGLSQNEVRATKQETAVLKHVSHMYIIGYRDTFEENGVVSIVMEYAAGGDLGRLIAKRMKEATGGARFTESEIKRYARQLGSALEYLHCEVHLLHRDIKPKNVFLSASGEVRLGDFGLSLALSKSDGQATTQVGTPLYMSPELAAGKPYDRSADVWAFGCTLFECMGFQPPWSELCSSAGVVDGGMKRLESALRNNTLNVMGLRAYYTEEMCELLSKLLAKKREERLPLSKLIAQLTEAPKVPASWGLSAEAQAALEAMNEAQPPEEQAEPPPAPKAAAARGSKALGASSSSKPGASSSKPGARGSSSRASGVKQAAPPVPTVPLWGLPDWTASMREPSDEEEGDDDDEDDSIAMGIEVHAAASVLQRSFQIRKNKKKAVLIQAPGEETPREEGAKAPPGIKIPARGASGAPSWGKGASSSNPPSWGKGAKSPPPSWGKGGATINLHPALKPPPKKPALKPSRVLRTSPSPRRPATTKEPVAFQATEPVRRPQSAGGTKARKPGLIPSRVKDGFG